MVKTPRFHCRGRGFDLWSGKFPHALRRSQTKIKNNHNNNNKEKIIMLLSRELTSGPETGCHCLQGDNPFLGSGRSTGSYKSREQRKVSQLRSRGQGPPRTGTPPLSQPGAFRPSIRSDGSVPLPHRLLKYCEYQARSSRYVIFLS